MGLDTKIPGDPASVEAAASWLRTLEGKVSGARSAVRSARSTAGRSWQGSAGAAFSARMDTAETKISDLSTTLTSYATSCDDYAAALRTAQSRMAQIRSEAAAAGLTVTGDVIEDPGPGPADPGAPPHAVGGPVPPAEMQAAMSAYNTAVAAYQAHQKLVAAYTKASGEVSSVDSQYKSACDDLHTASLDPGVKEVTELNAADIAGQITGAATKAYTLSALRASEKTFEKYTEEAYARMRTMDYSALGADARAALDHDSDVYFLNKSMAASYARAADDLADSEGGLTAAGALSHGLLLTGIGLDVYHDIHDGHTGNIAPDAVGDTAGYVAGSAAGDAVGSVAAGMLADTAIGATIGSAVPVVGTVAGAVVGAGVGIFATGAAKSLLEGGSVGDAIDAGAKAVTDTGKAIGDGASAAAHFIGGLF